MNTFDEFIADDEVLALNHYNERDPSFGAVYAQQPIYGYPGFAPGPGLAAPVQADPYVPVGVPGPLGPVPTGDFTNTYFSGLVRPPPLPTGPAKAREYALGFPPTTLCPGSCANIFTQPQVVFQGRRLVIPSTIAVNILINDLKIGKNSQFPSCNPVPAVVFQENGVGMDLALDTALVSMNICLSLENCGGEICFVGALLGQSLEYC